MCYVREDSSFTDRLRDDPKFKLAYNAWRKTQSGERQYRKMEKDLDTTYVLSVGKVIGGLATFGLDEGFGRTLGEGGRTPRKKNENAGGALNESEVSITINVDYTEKTNNSIARVLFEEGSHALDMGSNTKSAAEMNEAERLFGRGEEPRMILFEQQLEALSSSGLE